VIFPTGSHVLVKQKREPVFGKVFGGFSVHSARKKEAAALMQLRDADMDMMAQEVSECVCEGGGQLRSYSRAEN